MKENEKVLAQAKKQTRILMCSVFVGIEFFLFVYWNGLVNAASVNKVLLGIVTVALFATPLSILVFWAKVGAKNQFSHTTSALVPRTIRATNVKWIALIFGIAITCLIVTARLENLYQLTSIIKENTLSLLLVWFVVGVVTLAMISHRIVLLCDRVCFYEVFSSTELLYSQIKHIEIIKAPTAVGASYVLELTKTNPVQAIAQFNLALYDVKDYGLIIDIFSRCIPNVTIGPIAEEFKKGTFPF